MIKMYKNYKSAKKMIERTNKELFDNLKDVAPRYRDLSSNELKEEVNYVADILSYQLTEIFELTVGPSVGAGFSLTSVFNYVVGKKLLYSRLMAMSKKSYDKNILKLESFFDNKDITDNMCDIILLAAPKFEKDTFKYLNYRLNKTDGGIK